MKKIFLVLIVVCISLSSCEKDDICDAATSTTPRLIIDFYDFTNPTLQKNVTNLGIIGDGLSTVILYNGVSKIELPLDMTKDLSQYQFVLNYGNENPAFINTDNLQFKYTRVNTFVSRACGYKTLFQLDSANPFTKTDSATSDGLWMKNITLFQYAILNENETHLSISF